MAKIKRKNPPLRKKGKKVFAGNKLLKESTPEALRENIAVIGPFGPIAKFFGYNPETSILCFVEEPKNKKLLIKIAKGEIGGEIPMFALHRPIASRGTLDMFWSRPLNRKILGGAIQFFPIPSKKILVLTHMAVKPKWRRQGLNTKMVEYLQARYPGYELRFHSPTDMGASFMEKYGYQEYLPTPERNPIAFLRRFSLERDSDVSGISGTGRVAIGVQFPNGRCVMQWQTNIKSLAIYDTVDQLEEVHGHGGQTRLNWID